MKSYYRVLTIAGSDSCGGAGIQADIKTFASLGCYGMSVITALTAQNTTGVTAIHPIPIDFVSKQLDAVLTDIGVDAVKIGMLYSDELVYTVVKKLIEYKIKNIVLDPVMVAQSGSKLLLDEAVYALKTHFFPISTIITPNIPEAEVLVGHKLNDLNDLLLASIDLSKYGSKNVLIKGGHSNGYNSADILYNVDDNKTTILESKRIDTVNNHGTGCTLSSAIASYLAKGFDIEHSVRHSKSYIDNALNAGSQFKLGEGNGPVHHFFEFWQ